MVMLGDLPVMGLDVHETALNHFLTLSTLGKNFSRHFETFIFQKINVNVFLLKKKKTKKISILCLLNMHGNG